MNVNKQVSINSFISNDDDDNDDEEHRQTKTENLRISLNQIQNIEPILK